MELLKDLKGRDFLSLADFTPAQIQYLLNFADIIYSLYLARKYELYIDSLFSDNT